MTGTIALLKEISPHIPDAFINQLFSRSRSRGRRRRFSAAQLWRLHLLAVLTPVHSFNLLLQMLPEQKEWRRFAHLANRRSIPDVWMLNQFRGCCGVGRLREINEQLLQPLLPLGQTGRLSVAMMDATDLPASASGHKKREPGNTRPNARPLVRAHSKPGKVVFSWVTRNTAFASGWPITSRGYC